MVGSSGFSSTASESGASLASPALGPDVVVVRTHDELLEAST